ncbi:MAG TPA: sigma-70 family RNA polymerase sigma factor [Flavobacteriaceae bacterium]|nr:sigma-70 family RNA polymerase sigma factor [Flavobacteriaceae bacterium]
MKKIIKGCKKGDLKAQEELYRLFAPKLFGVSLKYSRNYHEAEDNLQEAFLVIFEKIHQYKNKGSFEGWLKRITMNTALQTYRKQSVFRIVDEESIKEAQEVTLREEEVSLDFLLKIIQELPDRYRMVFNLYVLDGYSHKEIADFLNISEGTSKSNLARARQNLKRKLEESQTLIRFVK